MLTIEAALNTKETELDGRPGRAGQPRGGTGHRTGELTDAQEELAKQQLLLNLAQQAMDDPRRNSKSKQDGAGRRAFPPGRAAGRAHLPPGPAGLEKQSQLEALVGVRTRIIKALSETSRRNKSSATVDPTNGSIMLESDVLFAYGSGGAHRRGKRRTSISSAGVICRCSCPPTTRNTSPRSTSRATRTPRTPTSRSSGSPRTALTRRRVCARRELPLPDHGAEEPLRELLTANGRSYSDPVYDANGQVDAAASRRVAFKFRLTDEQMIEQMQSILESADGTGN